MIYSDERGHCKKMDESIQVLSSMTHHLADVQGMLPWDGTGHRILESPPPHKTKYILPHKCNAFQLLVTLQLQHHKQQKCSLGNVIYYTLALLKSSV